MKRQRMCLPSRQAGPHIRPIASKTVGSWQLAVGSRQNYGIFTYLVCLSMHSSGSSQTQYTPADAGARFGSLILPYRFSRQLQSLSQHFVTTFNNAFFGFFHQDIGLKTNSLQLRTVMFNHLHAGPPYLKTSQ